MLCYLKQLRKLCDAIYSKTLQVNHDVILKIFKEAQKHWKGEIIQEQETEETI